MEPNLAPSPPEVQAPTQVTTPAVPDAPAVPQPEAPAPIVAEPGTVGENPFGNKMELLTIGMLALVASSYIYSLFYYRKAYEASNSVQNIQRQLDQLKLAVNKPA